MNPHDRAVDHLHLTAMRLGDRVHQPVPDASLAPPIEAIVGRGVGPITIGQIPPRCPGPQYPKDAIHNSPVVLTTWPRTACRKDGFNDTPLEVGEVVAHAPSLHPDQRLESLFADLCYYD